MRIVLRFKARDHFLPLNHRPFVMSFIKGALSQRYPALFHQFYKEDQRAQKNFCFAVVLNNFKVEGDKILLEDGIFSVIVSSYDKDLIVKFYNSFKTKLYYNTHIPSYGTSVEMIKYDIVIKEEIEANSIKIKFLSPLLVRQKEETGDKYLCNDDDEFDRCLQINVDRMIQLFGFEAKDSHIKLKPVVPKKVVVKTKASYINGNAGIYTMSGDSEVLNYLYLSGIGSRRSQGFGLFELTD